MKLENSSPNAQKIKWTKQKEWNFRATPFFSKRTKQNKTKQISWNVINFSFMKFYEEHFYEEISSLHDISWKSVSTGPPSIPGTETPVRRRDTLIPVNAES
jgi:hypothetical protein